MKENKIIFLGVYQTKESSQPVGIDMLSLFRYFVLGVKLDNGRDELKNICHLGVLFRRKKAFIYFLFHPYFKIMDVVFAEHSCKKMDKIQTQTLSSSV